MKFTHYIYITATLAILSSCSDDIITPNYTVGEADNAIQLSAGISESRSGIVSRAGVEDNHNSHLPFTNGTKAALRIDGDWRRSSTTTDNICLPTTATMGAVKEATDNKHNTLGLSPVIYWDDYGTADPENMNPNSDNGRDKGLTIYGAAVNGKTDAAPSVTDWTALSWTLVTDQTSGWSAKDLLISNNVKSGTDDGTYKFDYKSDGKLLEFTHAMSKITVNLTAGEGFADGKFVGKPSVTLLGFNYTGTVNIENKTSTPTANTTTNIQACINDGATWTSVTTAQGTALVFPGNSFENATDIIKINCDGNIYYVNATKINEVNTETNKKFEQGKNYIFNIKVNKTKIEVTATIKDWVDVETETIQPLININAQVGTIGATTGSLSAFNFYMSTAKDNGYSAYGNATGTADGTTKWQFKNGETNISLFWPTHNTHYFMRGVSPTTATVSDDKQIAVSNGAYSSSTSPSNLMIGAPEIADNTMCGNNEHSQVDMSTSGICARNNTINLNFRYVMSQVEVRLKSSGTDEKKNKVTIDGNTTVEIIGGYNKARIQLGTRLHDDYTDSDKSTSYSMNVSSATPTGFSKVMHDIIVPQTLTDDMQFKITVKNSDSTTDVYYAQLNRIKVKTTDGSGEFITEWKSGEHYIYELDIIKTEINVTATLTDWITVNADQNIWF